jgi:hypothetical protein
MGDMVQGREGGCYACTAINAMHQARRVAAVGQLGDEQRKVGADMQVQMYCAADVRGTVANADVIRAV